MENRAHAIAVGLFTLLLTLASIFSFWWLSGSRIEVNEYTVISQSPVTGLSAESSVKFRGVDVGKVTQIVLDPNAKTSILISIQVPANLQLSKETYAELRMQGITGLSYIDLNDESKTAPPLEDGSSIQLKPSFIDHLLDQGPQLVSQLEVLIANTSKLSETANRLVGDLDANKLNATLDNLEKASAKLQPALNSASVMFTNVGQLASDQTRKQLLQTLASLQETTDAARPLMGELNETAKVFKSAAVSLEANSSQVLNTMNSQTLPQLNALTNTMDHSLKHFDHLVDTLDDQPQSLIFGKPVLQPGPGETGFKP